MLDESFVDGATMMFKENAIPEEKNSKRYSVLQRFKNTLGRGEGRRHSVAGKATAGKTLAGKTTPSTSSMSRRSRTTSKKKMHRRMFDQSRTYFGTPPKMSKGSQDWAGQASPSVVGRMDKSEKKKQEAVFEITTGESKYVDGLNHIEAVYSKTMLTNSFVTPAEHLSIFSNLPAIAKAHAELNGMFKRARTGEGIANMGEMVVDWFQQWELEKEYGIYCANLAYGKHVLRKVIQKYKVNKDGRFEAFLQATTTLEKSQRQMLQDMLDAPRRRLQNYKLLLVAVRKCTDDQLPDAGHLDHAIQLLTGACHEVDKAVRDKGRDRIVAIQESIDMQHVHSWQRVDLVNDNVPLMLEGEATLKDGKPCKIFLFQHMLLITKESKHTPGKVLIVGRPTSLPHLEIESERVASFKGKARLGEDELACTISIRNNDAVAGTTKGTLRRGLNRNSSQTGKSTMIKFASKDERQEWASAIMGCKDQCNGEAVITFV